MRQDAVSIQRFYDSSLGRAAARVLSGKLYDLWGHPTGQSMLGVGYALPILEEFTGHTSHLVAAVHADHGPVSWNPNGRGNAAVTVGEDRLPFIDGQFDRVIVLHGLEECANPRTFLRELWRITAPEGRIVLSASNRSGLWARATKTPFGHGRPWSRPQLINLLSGGLFQVTASTSSLFMPPIQSPIVAAGAEGWETLGRYLLPGLGGVILVEAVKRLYADPGGGAVAPALEKARVVRPVSTRTRENH